MNRALKIKSLFTMFLFFFSLFCICYDQCYARIICLDILYAKDDSSKIVYLFGDSHDWITGRHIKEEVEQLTQLKKAVEQQNKHVTILVEDVKDFLHESLRSTAPDFCDDYFLSGLVQRVQQWAKSNIVCAYGIEQRYLLLEAFAFYNAYSVPPIMAHAFYSSYVLTFDDLFGEIEILCKNICSLARSINVQGACAEIVKEKMKSIQYNCVNLLNVMFDRKLVMDDNIYQKQLALFCEEIKMRLLQYGDNTLWIEELEKKLTLFAKQAAIEGGTENLRKQCDALREDVKRTLAAKVGDKVNNQSFWYNLRYEERLVNNAILPILIDILDLIIFLNLIKYLADGPVVVFAGAAHTENVRTMLATLGFVWDYKQSICFCADDKFPLNKIIF